MCEDGTSVGRDPNNNCNFYPCPGTNPDDIYGRLGTTYALEDEQKIIYTSENVEIIVRNVYGLCSGSMGSDSTAEVAVASRDTCYEYAQLEIHLTAPSGTKIATRLLNVNVMVGDSYTFSHVGGQYVLYVSDYSEEELYLRLMGSNSNCVKEGGLSNPTVSPSARIDCCDGLKLFYPPVEQREDGAVATVVGQAGICYDPNTGTPVCKYDNSDSEGWYYPNSQLLRYAECSSYSDLYTEEVKCVFDSEEKQTCYSGKYSCEGIGSCSVKVEGKKGSRMTWKSSCGGYSYTEVDGIAEYAKFSCDEEILSVPPFPNDEPNFEVKLYPGWNLVGIPAEVVRFVSNCGAEQKLLGYIYIDAEQKYYSLQDAKEYFGAEKFKYYLARKGFWVYSYKSCDLQAVVSERVSYNELYLSTGWNVLPVTFDMVGKSIETIDGDCDLNAIYDWNPRSNEWELIDDNRVFTEYDVGRSFVYKSDNSCKFGKMKVIPIEEDETVMVAGVIA